jgi:drug/metabolite transporter (DMT)-like permease
MSNNVIIILTLVASLTIVSGTFLVLMSISEKNATLTGLVEITYPIFTFIFAWIFLKEVQVNWESAIGGLLIFLGITLIFFKS